MRIDTEQKTQVGSSPVLYVTHEKDAPPLHCVEKDAPLDVVEFLSRQCRNYDCNSRREPNSTHCRDCNLRDRIHRGYCVSCDQRRATNSNYCAKCQPIAPLRERLSYEVEDQLAWLRIQGNVVNYGETLVESRSGDRHVVHRVGIYLRKGLKLRNQLDEGAHSIFVEGNGWANAMSKLFAKVKDAV